MLVIEFFTVLRPPSYGHRFLGYRRFYVKYSFSLDKYILCIDLVASTRGFARVIPVV